MISLTKFTARLIIAVLLCCEKVQSIDKNQVLQQCAENNNVDVKKIAEIRLNVRDPEKLPSEFLCTFICAWKMIEVLKDGQLNLELIKTDKFVLSFVRDKDLFLKCLAAIDHIENCDDAKKIFRCTHEFGDSYLEECVRETNLDEKKFLKWHGESKEGVEIETSQDIICLKKCISEKKRIIDEGGKPIKYDIEKC